MHIDISVFTSHSSVGVVNGAMSIAAVPKVGEFISFDSLTTRQLPHDLLASPPRLKVEHVLPSPEGSSADAIVMLSDLTLPSREHARKMAAWLQEHFGLYFDEFEI